MSGRGKRIHYLGTGKDNTAQHSTARHRCTHDMTLTLLPRLPPGELLPPSPGHEPDSSCLMTLDSAYLLTLQVVQYSLSRNGCSVELSSGLDATSPNLSTSSSLPPA